MKIKYSDKKPPHYEAFKNAFNVSWDKGVILPYGRTIHCKYPISEDLVAHEKVHIEQQRRVGKKRWVQNYLDDGTFRLDQEVPAYRAQLEYAEEHYRRHDRRALKKKIIRDMVRMYGGMCTKEEAEKLLWQNSLAK